ncbi:hypothetical protein ORI20_07280 [Mycobacterium sp. CVI_P3]|uniref:DUF998 domain-containing protein n=1 Tax=Mycobacterium pinniadriaticum TaxID=2994102 RepID=A0ABT3SA75_9MYCO|nr:hypothetical protein [Mycobacterium pinniadriaticum]MCX2930069.1 hypothetical protein [Mycobacterium pinniadriaticum]MCX2936282.1 hypothetical protein [Mycobacterium pinniadriaticum]
MTERHQRLCIWVGLMFLPLFWLGLLVAGWFPPPTPNMSVTEVTDMFDADRARIRIGVLILTSAAPLLACYGAALTHQIRRSVGAASPLATAQTLVAACLILEFIFPQMIWQAGAFRAERSPDLVQLCYDMGWLMYIGVVGTAIVQMLLCGVAILQDRRPAPLVPRWAAYVCFWSAIGVAGGSFCVFTRTGPLAWNGLIAFWLLAVAFFVWMLTMSTMMLRASRIHEEDSHLSPLFT